MPYMKVVYNRFISSWLTVMNNSSQSVDDGVHSRIVFFPELQALSRVKGLQKGLHDTHKKPNNLA